MLQLLLSPSVIGLLLPILPILYIFATYLTNPLRKVPAAHSLAPLTSLWINYVRWAGQENRALKAAHDKQGPIMCLGPSEISVNCVRGGIRDIYAGGFEKGNGKYGWYEFFTNYGVGNMFSTSENKPHSTRKRMLSNVYSKSVVTSSPSLFAQTCEIILHRFLPRLAASFSNEKAGQLSINPVLNGATMDIVTGYIFGLQSSSRLLERPTELAWFLSLYYSRRSYNFWPQEHPKLTAFLERWFGYRLCPRWVDEANGEIEKWTRSMCESASAVSRKQDLETGNIPVVYQQLATALSKEAKKAGKEKMDLTLPIASEVLDHLAAGFDTSGITLTYVIHELSKHMNIQTRLQQELRTLSPAISHSSSSLPDPKTVDALPYLHAVLWETLRLHSAIPGPQPRFTPPQGCKLGPEDKPFFIPGGVRVSASAGLLHLNEEVYEGAGEWKPDRWLDLEKADDEKRRDMESRWFWAFGSGGRMCVGSHLAVYQMKYIIAALYSSYTTTIVDDAGIEQSDAYTAPPKSDRLDVQLAQLNN